MLASFSALIGCGDDTDVDDTTPPSTIRLAQNPWLGAELNASVAAILLEEELGFRAELVPIDENAQWDRIAAGDLHASLEVWPSGHTDDIERYIHDEGSVANGGLLGPAGRIGWYVPSYVVAAEPGLASWDGFADSAVAAAFATPQSSGRGQFLGMDPTFVQFDADITRNLGLDFEVVFSGSESATIAAVENAFASRSPLLFYFWTPHALHSRLALTRIALPPHSEECYARAGTGGIDCDYPRDDFFKILWPGLSREASLADQFLRNFNYRTEDQVEMIEAVEVDGKSPGDAAREWIEANRNVWQEWLP